jgi:hypothetical protein
VLNEYYEDVYKHLPHMILPAILLLVGATVLLIAGKRRKPNNTSLSTEGAPSVEK